MKTRRKISLALLCGMIYRVIGKIPALRNLSNKLAVLEVCRNGE